MTSAKAHAERRRLEWVEASGLDLELLDDAVDTWPRFGSRIWAGSRPDWITPGYHEELWWVALPFSKGDRQRRNHWFVSVNWEGDDPELLDAVIALCELDSGELCAVLIDHNALVELWPKLRSRPDGEVLMNIGRDQASFFVSIPGDRVVVPLCPAAPRLPPSGVA